MILLTGATGYLGSQIARELAARKMRFRVLVRDASRLPLDAVQAGCEVVAGDLCDPLALRKALRGAQAVIHTAALGKMWVRDRRDYWRVNVEGLQNLLQVAADSGVRRVVYTSSFLALGPSADTDLGEGLRHPGPYLNEYVESKAQALAWLRDEGFPRFPVVALLPGVVYGPGPKTEGNLVGRMIDQHLAGKFPGVLGAGKQRWSFSFNADVVAAHLTALEKGNVGEEYVLGGDNRSLNDFLRLLGDISGVHRRVHHLPFVAGKMVGAFDVLCARLFHYQPRLTTAVVEIFKHDWVYSSGKAVRELGYRVTPLEEGLKRTIDSLAH
jgi:nucleoside-diphosphate-sugar epimerase